MNKNEFENRFMKLISQFGSKNYSQDRLNLIFQEVRTISAGDFELVVSHLIGSSKFAPIVPDFRKAISDLGIRQERNLSVISESNVKPSRDITYKIRDNIWANNDYVMVRGKTIRECKFIMKSEHPDHPLVIEDKQVRSQRLDEVRKHLANRTYADYFTHRNPHIEGMTTLRFDPKEGA